MDDKDNIYFILQIPIEDTPVIMAKLKEIGLKEELETEGEWLKKYLDNSYKNKVVNDFFLVSNTHIWEWDVFYHFDPKAMDDLQVKLGIPVDAIIPEYNLDDLLKLQKEDIAYGKDRRHILDSIPPYRRTEEVCRNAIEYDFRNIEWVPAKHHSNEIIAYVLSKDGELLEHIDKEKLNTDLCTIAMNSRPFYAFKFIPKNLINEQMCQMYVDSDGKNISFIPVELQSKEMCMSAIHHIKWEVDRKPELFTYLLDFKYPDMQLEGLNQMARRLDKDQQEDIRFVQGHPLNMLPENRRTFGVCIAALLNYTGNIRDIPHKILNDEIIDYAIKRDGILLQYIPPDRFTRENILFATQNNYQAIQFVGEEMINREICIAAIEGAVRDFPESCMPLAYIPYPDICLEGIGKLKNTIVSGEEIGQAINPLIMDEKIAKALLEMDIQNFKYLPDHLKNKDNCAEAIKQDGGLLCKVPPQLRTKELCLEAIKTNVHAIKDMPDTLKTKAFCMESVKTHGNAIEFVPEGFKSERLCEEAVKNSTGHRIIAFLPYPDLCEKVVDRSIESGQLRECMQMIKPEVINEGIALKVAKNDISCLSFIPEGLKNKNFCDIVIKADPLALNYLPDSYKTLDICRNAIGRNITAMNGIPEILKTPDFYKELILKNPLSLLYIPDKLKSKMLSQLAIDNYSKAGNEAIAVFSGITDSELCLKALQKETDPKIVLDIVFYMQDKVKNTDITLEAVRKNGACLPYFAEKLLTKEVCEAAIQNNPSYLNWVPESKRTPEMYLRAKKMDVILYEPIPKAILKNDTIYSFDLSISNQIKDNLSFDKVKDLYSGKTIFVEKFQSCEGLKENQQVRYNKSTFSLEYRPYKESISTKLLNTLLPKKKNGFKL